MADHPQTPQPGQLGALRIGRPGRPEEALWLGYKRSIPDRRRLARGVSVIWQKLATPRRNWLIRAGRAGSFPADDYELPVGNTFSDGSIHITPVERGGVPPALWVDVEVQLSDTPANLAPTVSWTRLPAAEAEPFQTLRFDVAANDPNGDALAYHWDLGDGSEVSQNSPSLIHTYESPGSYQVSVVVSDMRGGRTRLDATVDIASEEATWTQRVSGTTGQLNAVAASSSRAVAVSGSGLIVHSSDGIQWTSYDLKTAQNVNAIELREIASDGSHFIAVGRERSVSGGTFEGCIYHSANGISWTRTHTGGSLLLRVAKGGDSWLVTGENSTMLASSNGLNWTPVDFPETDHIQGIAYGNGLWLAMADRSSDRTWAYTSTNLTTWTERTWAADFSNNQIVRPVRWMAGQFYLGGFAVGLRTVTGDAATLNSAPELTGMNINDMVQVGDTLYVAGDINEGEVSRGHVHVSFSGQSWKRIPNLNAALLRGITEFGGRLLAVGNGGEIWQSGTLFAPDPGSWRAWQAAHRAQLGVDDDPMQILTGTDLPNLYHYAVGNPAAGGAIPLMPYAARDATGRLKLVVPRAADRADIQYQVLRSTDLRAWSPAGVTITEDLPTRLEAVGAGPGIEGREFLRFRAELVP